MSHPEQMAFLEAIAEANEPLVQSARVLEIGSLDVNGSVRKLFLGCTRYVGVDLAPGIGVDIVGFGHEIDLEAGTFDIAVSAECFEHDQHWNDTFTNMVRLTRPGGVVAFTCASHGRPEHGTRRTCYTDSPGTQALGLDYYRNLDAEDFKARLPLDEWFSSWRFWTNRNSFDLYFAGVRTGEGRKVPGVLPDEEAVAATEQMMSRTDRLLRLPLRLAHLIIDNEDRYQRVILHYWRMVQKVGASGIWGRTKRATRRLIPR